MFEPMKATRRVPPQPTNSNSKKPKRPPRVPEEPPDWDALRERVGVVPERPFYLREHLEGLRPDARMVVALRECVGHLRSDGGQFFLTNGVLAVWCKPLAAGLRRLGTPRARTYAKELARMVVLAEKACVLEDQIDSDLPEDEDPAMEALNDIAGELGWIAQLVDELDEALRRDVVNRLDGKRPRPSARPWPKVPRLSKSVRRAWG
jgi:hypothetical protein